MTPSISMASAKTLYAMMVQDNKTILELRIVNCANEIFHLHNQLRTVAVGSVEQQALLGQLAAKRVEVNLILQHTQSFLLGIALAPPHLLN